MFLAWFSISDGYLFQLIFLNCNNFVLSRVERVTTGTESFAYVTARVASVGALNSGLSPYAALAAVSVITQSLGHVKFNVISQLIKGILRVLQKLLKYFSITAFSTPFLWLSLWCASCNVCLKF